MTQRVQREFPLSPLIGVGAVIFDEAGRVLLIQRATEPNRGHWSIPGGLVDLGETIIAAVCREVAEETGLSVEPQAVIEVVDRIYTDSEGPVTRVRYHYVVVDYWCRSLSGIASPGSDASDVRWANQQDWKNNFALEPLTIEVIDKGWAMAQAAGAYDKEKGPS